MYVGIDYSLSCPAICIAKDEECTFKRCSFYFLTTKKKYDDVWNIGGAYIDGQYHAEWECPEERYSNISTWAKTVINKNGNANQITIEDYAMGAKGRVFHIGENTGVLKYRLWKENHYVKLISPSEVKKFATGKGNANKEAMYEAFLSEHKYDIKELLGQGTLDSPVTDIIDAYYICKAGIQL